MTKRQLFKDINSLCRNLDEDFDINNGGCCFVAAVIAQGLEKCNISYSVRYYELHGCHYAIQVSDRVLNRGDFTGTYELEEYDSDDLFTIYDNGIWNNRYDINYNEIIEQMFEELFDKYVEN